MLSGLCKDYMLVKQSYSLCLKEVLPFFGASIAFYSATDGFTISGLSGFAAMCILCMTCMICIMYVIYIYIYIHISI